MEAAKIMGRKNEAEHLAVAALASKKGGSEQLATAFAVDAVFKSLEKDNLELALGICSDHPDLQVK